MENSLQEMIRIRHVPTTPHRVSSMNSISGIGVPAMMTKRREIVKELNPSGVSDTICVAVAKDVKDSKLNLIWAIQNSGGKRICILHVHVPVPMIPLMGAKFLASALTEQEVEAYREIERQDMHKTLDAYLLICQRMGVRAEKLHLEMDCIEKGIVELISRYNLQSLVMGAASDKYHSKRMTDLRSKKAIYVCEHAPASCRIQFICKGYLIHTRVLNPTRDNSLDRFNVEGTSSLVVQQQMPDSEVGHSPDHVRSKSVSHVQSHWIKPANPAQEPFPSVSWSISTNCAGHGRSMASVSSSEGFSTPQSKLSREACSDETDGVSRYWSPSPSVFSVCSDNSTASVETALTSNLISGGNESLMDFNMSGLSSIISSIKEEDLYHSSPPSVLDGGMDDSLYDQLEQAMVEAESARRDAYRETVRRGKAEKDASDATLLGEAQVPHWLETKDTTILYQEELQLRKELEEALHKAKEEIENMQSQIDKVNKELQLALHQKSSRENQIASTEPTIKELQEKTKYVVHMLQKDKTDLQMQRDNASREAEELRRKLGEASSRGALQLFSEFSFSEIEEATCNFNPSLKIGEGGYGSIFKGVLRHTEVAIKMLNPNSTQGPSEFQQEVEVLSKLRHPNLITLIGACTETQTLVYEYLPNGSLEDRLSCENNTPPLSWQTRIRIATELCSALIFLHSSKPHSIVHGDLKPSNILLDANLVSKLSDFRICRMLTCQEDSTEFWITNVPKGTFAYMDPEFFASGELTSKSDVYSFGIVLLRLITGRPVLGIKNEVLCALNARDMKSLLDPLAGDWPIVIAEELARMALRCCDMNRKSRPELCSDVWRVLEPMRTSCGGTCNYTFGPSSQGPCQTPSYFVCPISQEVMRDPHVAADGFTYEAEAIRKWLESGHDTSPRTNSKLPHLNLVPNHALRSAIQYWLQNH